VTVIENLYFMSSETGEIFKNGTQMEKPIPKQLDKDCKPLFLIQVFTQLNIFKN